MKNQEALEPIVEFIFNNREDRIYSKFKETEKAICFTWDFKGYTKHCSCRMAGCYHKTTPYTKRYYVWIPKSIIKKGIVNKFSVRSSSDLDLKYTTWNIQVKMEHLKSSFDHYVKRDKKKKAA